MYHVCEYQTADLERAMRYLTENNKKLADVVNNTTPAQVNQSTHLRIV